MLGGFAQLSWLIRQSFWGSHEGPQEVEQPWLGAGYRLVLCRGEAQGKEEPCSPVASRRHGDAARSMVAGWQFRGLCMQRDTALATHHTSHYCEVREGDCVFSDTCQHSYRSQCSGRTCAFLSNSSTTTADLHEIYFPNFLKALAPNIIPAFSKANYCLNILQHALSNTYCQSTN